MSESSSVPGPDIEARCLTLNAAGITARRLAEGPAAVVAFLNRGGPGDIPLTREEQRRVAALAEEGFAPREAEEARKRGLTILTPVSSAYPPLLLQIPDPPLALYVEGAAEWLARPAVAIVGSRNATMYGRSAAQALASQLAVRGITIVSGFARGIDGAAHASAIRSGGATVAVLGCGPDIDYPRGHGDLRRAVAGRGCLVSEFPLGRRPDRTTFPRRNRIISGLSLGTIVVEAQERSGALITARHALEQNREVFAVPGSIFSPSSRGPHLLLKDGARMIESAEDALAELSAQLPAAPLASAAPAPAAGTLEARVLEALRPDPVHVDELSQKLAVPMSQLMPVLSILELKRCARQHAGKQFSRA